MTDEVTVTMRSSSDTEYAFSEPVEDWEDLATVVSEIASLERIGWIFVSIESQIPTESTHE